MADTELNNTLQMEKDKYLAMRGIVNDKTCPVCQLIWPGKTRRCGQCGTRLSI